jgi:hypothetical protein
MSFDPVVQPPAKAAPVTFVKAASVAVANLPESFKTTVAAPQLPTGKKTLGKVNAPPAERIPYTSVQGAPRKNPPRGKGQGQESPVSKDPHPMATRTQQARRALGPSTSPLGDASRAGGLRGVAGSGQTGYVCGKLSPSPKPGS